MGYFVFAVCNHGATAKNYLKKDVEIKLKLWVLDMR